MARVSRPKRRSRSPDYLVGLGGAVATRGPETNKPSEETTNRESWTKDGNPVRGSQLTAIKRIWRVGIKFIGLKTQPVDGKWRLIFYNKPCMPLLLTGMNVP